MARAITKEFGSICTHVEIMRVIDGAPTREGFEFDGKKSLRAIQAALKAKLKTSNFMICGEPTYTGGANERYTVDAQTFYDLSEYCEGGVSYGHDTITATFKVSRAKYYDEQGEHTFDYLGTTTDNKLRNAIIAETKNSNILVLPNPDIYEVRKYMTKDEFIRIAKKLKTSVQN